MIKMEVIITIIINNLIILVARVCGASPKHLSEVTDLSAVTSFMGLEALYERLHLKSQFEFTYLLVYM